MSARTSFHTDQAGRQIGKPALKPPEREFGLEDNGSAHVQARGLRWQIRCASGARRSLGETDMLLGQSQQWRIFSMEVEIRQADDCHGQTLRLYPRLCAQPPRSLCPARFGLQAFILSVFHKPQVVRQ